MSALPRSLCLELLSQTVKCTMQPRFGLVLAIIGVEARSNLSFYCSVSSRIERIQIFAPTLLSFWTNQSHGAPCVPRWADWRYQSDWLFKITGLSLLPVGFFTKFTIREFWHFLKNLWLFSGSLVLNSPELLIRRHFLAEKRGTSNNRKYFPNLGVVYPLLR